MAEDDDKKAEFQRRVEEALAQGFDIPEFPNSTPLDALAMAQNEVVNTYERHGFKRNEALYLTSAMFNGNPGIAPSE